MPQEGNRPPGDQALAELALLQGLQPAPAAAISLQRYAQLGEAAC